MFILYAADTDCWRDFDMAILKDVHASKRYPQIWSDVLSGIRPLIPSLSDSGEARLFEMSCSDILQNDQHDLEHLAVAFSHFMQMPQLASRNFFLTILKMVLRHNTRFSPAQQDMLVAYPWLQAIAEKWQKNH